MKRNVLIAAIAATIVSATALAHGGFGPQGFGPGYGPPGFGAGFGPHGGMMGAFPGAGAGYCMGADAMAALNLSAEQRDKVAAIEKELSAKRLALAEKMRDLRSQSFQAGRPMDSATYEAMAAVRKEMFELSRQGREQVGAVLTPEQRAQWRPGWRGAPFSG
jgi:Spy/CpxP family protein refolding chaperone